jgi:ABC-2 type transport system ATP-binding protein
MPRTSAAALSAVDLVKTYPAGRRKPRVRALDGLSLEVAAGTVFALLGPNGAGKSTTVKIFTTLCRADSGSASVLGLDVDVAPDRVRRRIGLVSQKPSSDPMATGRENLVLAARLHGTSGRDAGRRAEELLSRFELTDSADRLAKTYSGGMSRKLDVAIGLMHRPQVLFLDEPTTGLDPEARREMWEEIRRISVGEQITVLLTTHYLDEADQLADRLAIVDRGKVVAEGSPDKLKQELHGDLILVELASGADGDRALALIMPIPGLRDAVVDGATVRARTDNGARAVPAVMAALESGAVEVASVTTARPSLDDVYLRYAGRSFEAAA